MREIKFRAWGYSGQEDKYKMFLDYPISFSNTGINTILNDMQENVVVLMQYTGLKDKNGKEIYEGDVISTDDSIINDGYAAINENFLGGSPVKPTTFNFKVQWDNDDASFALVAIDGDDEMELSTIHDWDRDMTVIGNIWEHPELLKI